MSILEFIQEFPIQVTYGVVAIAGGTARYMQGYATTGKFSFGVFAANIFISGFSGWMFALLGLSMNLPPQMLLMMAGVGGFMGTEAVNFLVDYITKKVIK